MAKNYQDKISETIKKLKKVQDELLNGYLLGIGEFYKTLDTNERQIVLKRLEGLVQDVDGKNLILQDKFDPEKARRIRKETGLTQRKLAEIFGFTPQQLSLYERGNHKVSYPRKSGGTRKYLEWLKEHGYDPFDL